MKKMLSFVTALTVTMSSFSAFASFYNEDPFSGSLQGPAGYKVPVEDGVETKVTIESKWDAASAYIDTTSVNPLKKKYSNVPEQFDSRAILDMGNVAKEWDKYLDVAAAFIQKQIPTMSEEEARNMAISYVELTGEYTITIVYEGKDSGTALKGIDNSLLATPVVGTGYSWETVGSYCATDFFVEPDVAAVTYSEDTTAETKTFVLKMKVKDDIDKTKLNAFFSDENPDKQFVLSIPDNKANKIGKYEIKGTFEGYVDISVSVPGTTADAVSSKVVFGTGADKYIPDFKPFSEDTDYVDLYEDSKDGGGGGGGRPTTKPTATPTVEPTEAPTEAPTERPSVEPQTGGTDNGAKLDYDNHYAYIIGYPTDDDTNIVKPENDITRAEVATIFFRLLTDESRAKFWTTENEFSDVESADWFNNAISTAASAGIVNGYEDGTFRPNNAITRAEFAAIASRFANVPYDGEEMFSDIADHWAKDNINEAAIVGWINGYEDGTFRPNKNITRAEAMTLINRVLYRYVEEEDLRDDMIKWDDNTEDKWYYANVQEATNSHTYDREAIGTYEKWTAITAPRDWEALEKETSTAASAGKEDSVFEGLDQTEDASDVTMEEVIEEATEVVETEATEEVDEEITDENAQESTDDEA